MILLADTHLGFDYPIRPRSERRRRGEDFFNNLKHSELSLLQAYALTHLFFKGPIKISELCEHMLVSPGAASQMVDRLEKLEMVARIADPKDRRVRKVVVLEKGERFVQ